MKKTAKYALSFVFLLLVSAFPGYAEQEPVITEFTRNGKVIRPVYGNGKITIDWQTTQDPDEKVTCTFTGSPTVRFISGNRGLVRLDGLLDNTCKINKFNTELTSHYHRDHISRAIFADAQLKKSFNYLIGPYPVLEESRNGVFNDIDARRDNEKEPLHALGIDPSGKMKDFSFINIGNFYYATFNADENITIELFKYNAPKHSNINTDGLIYRITNYGVSYLLFGDFDDPDGIGNLLEAFAEIKKRRAVYEKDIEELKERQILNIANAVGKGVDIVKTLYSPVCPRCLRYHNVNWVSVAANLIDTSLDIVQIQRAHNSYAKEIYELDKELATLPTLKADVIKWPHHAYIFDDNDRIDKIIRKMNEVVDPWFIIWQTHPAQKAHEFEEYINPERFDFHDKFKCSDKIKFEFISLLDSLNAREAS